MDPQDLELLIWGVALPMAIAFAVAALGSALRGRSANGGWVGALAVAGGYLIAHGHLVGFVRPDELREFAAVRIWAWQSWLVPLAALVGLVAARQRLLALGQRVVLGIALLFTLTHPMLLRGARWPEGNELFPYALVGLVAAGWWAHERVARREGPGLAFGFQAATAALAAAATGLSGSLLLAKLLGGLAAAAGGAAVLGLLLEWRGQRPTLAAGAAPVAAVAGLGLIATAVMYSNLSWDKALLLLASIGLGTLFGLPPLAKRTGLGWQFAKLLLVLIPALIAVGLAGIEFQAREEDPYAGW